MMLGSLLSVALVSCLVCCCALHIQGNTTNCTRAQCPTECTCCNNQEGQLEVTCQLNKTHISNLTLPSHTHSLSLAGSYIPIIGQHSFQDTVTLSVLNLSYTGLREWNITPDTTLPYLKTLDITGNYQFNFNKDILRLLSLAEVRGVSWNEHCRDCKLSKINIMEPDAGGVITNISQPFTGEPPSGFDGSETVTEIEIGNSSHNCKPPRITTPPFEFIFMGFQTICVGELSATQCAPECKLKPHNKKTLRLTRVFFTVCYPLGGIVISINALVLINVILSKKLRQNVSMILIANMAACDILLGIYTLIIADFNPFRIINSSFKTQNLILSGNHCQVAGALFTIGQTVSVATSLLLTIEKYISIVHVMDPGMRMNKKHVAGCIFAAYLASILYLSAPYYTSSLHYSVGFLCTFPVNHRRGNPFFVIGIALFLLLYLAMIPLYVRIFVFVRRSGSQIGVNRDAMLAKNLAVLIGTNFVFFTTPMSILLVNTLLLEGHSTIQLDEVRTPANQAKYLILYWLPIAFLAFNSQLNPLLYAFRRRAFQREFISCACTGARLTARIHRVFSFLTSSTRSSFNSPQSRMESYKMERHPESQRMRANSQNIPGACADRPAIVLCKANKINDTGV